ncbi:MULTISPECIES: replication initiation protein [unclassified Azospirillum]|uniref:replication initiation protein n=1 Tax=unclassified Azospirillum TaxID=2630922 RepID=UPI000B65C7D3|nr:MULTISPECIES: replication initiation protein [unclassified Azospirillum]SNS46755.1 Initiator Replication protein [Azospirillum sp. RU38E]SNS65922.1 Initiator Replication protein [Azospirillum sp. RU37A]
MAASAAMPKPEMVRPRISGNVLDLSTDPTLPKPRTQIEVMETGNGLTLADRKLFNVLLAYSWDKLADPNAVLPPFRASTADLRRAIGDDTESNNVRLRQSFDRLMQTLVRFPYWSEADQQLKEGGSPLLAFRALPRGAGYAEWEFPPKLRPLLAKPGAWARIHLAICAQFSSKYSLALYELLSLRVNLREPRWEVTIDDLRESLGCTEKMPNYAHFQRRVLDPGIKEINELSGLLIAYEEIRSHGRGRKVEKLIFDVKKKSNSDLVATARITEFAKAPVGKGAHAGTRDQDTPDLEDGRTDRERGPAGVLGLIQRVSLEVVEELVTQYPDVDMQTAIFSWAEWALRQKEPCRNPSAAFRAWLEKLHPTASGPVQITPPGSEPSAAAVRAAQFLSGEPYTVRARWYRRAKELGAKEMRAATAPENLPRWVGLVAEEVVAGLRA